MEQPPPVPGLVAHPGLGAAASAHSAANTPTTWLELAAQLQYGYVLLDGTGSSRPAGPYGTTLEKGSILQFRMVSAPDGTSGFAIFTSQAEIHAGLPPERLAQASGFIQSAPALGDFLGGMGGEFVVIDPSSSNVVVPRERLTQLAKGPNDPGIRAALELGHGTRLAVIEALVHHDGTLQLAAHPSSFDQDGRPGKVRLRTATPPGGTTVLNVYTSPVEVALSLGDDVPVSQSYREILERVPGAGYDGIILNHGSTGLILTRSEVTSALTRRTKLAAKAAKKDARGQR